MGQTHIATATAIRAAARYHPFTRHQTNSPMFMAVAKARAMLNRIMASS